MSTRHHPSSQSKVTTDPNTVLTAWEKHFRNLSAKNEELSPAISCMEEQVEQLMIASFRSEDCLLDVPFCAEEIDVVFGKLKSDKYAASIALKVWWSCTPCVKIGNYIIDSEHVPDPFKFGIIIPVYKRGGKDPLDTNSYR